MSFLAQRLKSFAFRQDFAFLIVGSVGSACYVGLAQAIYMVGLEPHIASAAAYLLSLPVGYFGQRHFTFRSSRLHSTALARYSAVQVVGLFISTATTFFASGTLGFSALAAFLVAAIGAALASYFLQKCWVF